MKIKMKDLDRLPFVEETIVSHGRWELTYEVIFKQGCKFYRTEFSVPSSELSEGSGTQPEDSLECEEVVEVEVLKKQWIRKS